MSINENNEDFINGLEKEYNEINIILNEIKDNKDNINYPNKLNDYSKNENIKKYFFPNIKENMLKQMYTYHKIFNINLDNMEDCLCFLYAYSIHKSNIKNKIMDKNIDDCLINVKII